LAAVLRSLAAALAAALPVIATGPRIVGVASSMEKLRPGAHLPRADAIDLEAARGECRSAQIAVRPPRRLSALSATAEPLEGPSRITVELYREATLELSRPSGPGGEAGSWPDPLIPARDPFFGERRRAFPVAVAAGVLQAIWVEVCVPQDARPGRYRGAVRLGDGGPPQAAVPVTRPVMPVSIPATNSMTATFGLPTRTGTRALGRPDDRLLARALAAAALRHRISPHGLSYDPPYGRCTAARCELDWTAYDAELRPILDGTLVPGVRGTFADARVTARDWKGPEADLVALFREWHRHFDTRGWSDDLWLYTLDEPKPGQIPELARRARAARRGGVRVLATTLPTLRLDGVVSAFAPVLNFFEGRPPGSFAVIRDAKLSRAPLRPFWYTSCMSHGCDDGPSSGLARALSAREFRGWPGYEIDRPAASARVMGWLAYRERVAGELYYDMLAAWDGDPWRDVRRFAGNGDGTLLYPGSPERLGGEHPFPVESIRLKLIREGLQDGELLRLAERRGLGELAQRLARRIAPSLRNFERDPAAWSAAHRTLGEAIAAADAH
jgi:hypothetical protein